MPRNPYYRSIQDVIRRYEERLDSLSEDIASQAESPLAQQLDSALGLINKTTALKIIHPLFISLYRAPRMKFKTKPLRCIGLDVETNHLTGEPMLIGVYHPEPIDNYRAIFEPKLADLYEVVHGLAETGQHIVTWGNLDIQILIRLFAPNEEERSRISRGISANVKDGAFVGSPPLKREIDGKTFYIAHYIPGRSLKLGILSNGYESIVWVFNLSQFFPGTIPNTAKGLQLPWIDYDKSTHLIDWNKYRRDRFFRIIVEKSNGQDARTVQLFSEIIQERFFATFEAYPSLLVSTGSLTDAAVAKLLSPEDYRANSWTWLRHNIWTNQQDDANFAEVLLAEAFSAGYVDQYGIGFYGDVCTADIAAAYPHKIRSLPDLRYAHLATGTSITDAERLIAENDVETVVLRGLVSIPKTLHYHPITIKTQNRENYRPSGMFYASYTWEERAFCIKNGARFEQEEWFAVVLDERRPSPIALVSKQLGILRDKLLAQLAETTDYDAKVFLDGQQYVTKVIDNSIYGKTVMTTEQVEDIDGTPQITGYVAGDRFNLLYGTLITSRTRIQIAEACTAIEKAGGRPIMTMTDSIYWVGSPDMLPKKTIRKVKTPGYFEEPHIVTEFFILKTGQYEYKDGGKWFYKLRGLPVPYEDREGNASFFRTQIRRQVAARKHLVLRRHPKDVIVTINARRLISIGSKDLTKLGLVEETTTDIKPFVLSSKQATSYVMDWPKAINGHVWLAFTTVKKRDAAAANYPLFFLRELIEERIDEVDTERTESVRFHGRDRTKRIKDLKRLFVWKATAITQLPPPRTRYFDVPWSQLENHYGILREELGL